MSLGQKCSGARAQSYMVFMYTFLKAIMSSASLLVIFLSFSILRPEELPIIVMGSLVLNPNITSLGDFPVAVLTELLSLLCSTGKNFTQLASWLSVHVPRKYYKAISTVWFVHSDCLLLCGW